VKQIFLFLLTVLCFQQSFSQGLTTAKAPLIEHLVRSEDIQAMVTQGTMGTRLAANNYLVTHHEIYQKVQDGYFLPKAGAVIPDNNLCITVAEAKAWLNLEEASLPTNGRMPLWQELVPLLPTATFTFSLNPAGSGPVKMEVQFSNTTLHEIRFKWGYCVHNNTIPQVPEYCFSYTGASGGGTPVQAIIPAGSNSYTQYTSTTTAGANFGYLTKIVVYDMEGISTNKMQLAAGQGYQLVFIL